MSNRVSTAFTLFRWTLIPSMLLLTGCGSGEGTAVPDALTEVSGKVTINGEPASGVALSFLPQGTSVGTGGFAVTDDSGGYTVIHRSQTPGIEPGQYLVTFSKMVKPDGSPMAEGETAADVMAENMIPPTYSDPASENNPHKVTVTDNGPLTFDFDLQIK